MRINVSNLNILLSSVKHCAVFDCTISKLGLSSWYLEEAVEEGDGVLLFLVDYFAVDLGGLDVGVAD